MLYMAVRLVSFGIVVVLTGALFVADLTLDLPRWQVLVGLVGICLVTLWLDRKVVGPTR